MRANIIRVIGTEDVEMTFYLNQFRPDIVIVLAMTSEQEREKANYIIPICGKICQLGRLGISLYACLAELISEQFCVLSIAITRCNCHYV